MAYPNLDAKGSLDSIVSFEGPQDEFPPDSPERLLQNIISRVGLSDLVVDRNRSQKYPHIYSVTTTPRVDVTDQKSSGRCWEFAGHNILRRSLIERYNLNPDFELSQSYFFFWDKFERLNWNMECIIRTRSMPIGNRAVQTLLADPTCDGGQWDMFVNIIKKYGVVPKSVYPESKSSSCSRPLNAILKRLFRKYALEVRKMESIEHARYVKDRFLFEVFGILVKTFGTPPTKFVWRYVDKDKKYYETGEISPLDFYECFIYPLNVDDYVCLINDPRKGHNYYSRFTVEYLGNVVGGQRVSYLNVPIEEMKKVTQESIRGNDAVWFGCDVGKDRSDTVMDDTLVRTGLLFGVDFKMTKEERLISGESLMTHAMVFTAFQTDRNEKVIGYEVENSWGKGKNSTPPTGYYHMSDTWFSEYVYEVVVHKKYLTDEMKEALTDDHHTVLPLWDPMGSLAC